jgi:hypothetical protein
MPTSPVATADEPDGIRPRGVEDGRVVQGQTGAARLTHHPGRESALPGLSRAGHDHHGSIRQGFDQRSSEMTRALHTDKPSERPVIRGVSPCDPRTWGQRFAGPCSAIRGIGPEGWAAVRTRHRRVARPCRPLAGRPLRDVGQLPAGDLHQLGTGTGEHRVREVLDLTPFRDVPTLRTVPYP